MERLAYFKQTVALTLLFFFAAGKAQVPTYDAVYPRPFLQKMFFYYPTHETLDRVVRAVLKRERGAYINFSKRDIANTYNMQRVFGVNGQHVFKALPLQCKDAALPVEEHVACINDSEMCYQKLIEPMWAVWGAGVNHLYAPNALLAAIDQDIHYAARFIRLLKNASDCLVLTDHPGAAEVFNNASMVPIKGRALPDIVRECQKHISERYTVVFVAAGSAGRFLIPTLLEQNCFVFDCGDTFDLLDQPTFLKLKQKVNHNVRVLYTAAIIKDQTPERQAEYEKSVRVLNSYWYEPYIVEACVTGPTFFNDIAQYICYTQTNLDVRNKGVNEVRSMRRGLLDFKFDDDDMIVKITGRYFFKNDLLLRMIEDNPDIDGFISIYTMTHFAFTGCFALRYKYFKEIINKISLVQMEQYWIDVERVIMDYVRSIEKDQSARIKYIDELHLEVSGYNGSVSYW